MTSRREQSQFRGVTKEPGPMTETVLLDAPFANDGGAVVARAKAKAEEFVDFVRESVNSALDRAQRFRRLWEGLQRVSRQGHVEALRVMLCPFLHSLAEFIAVVGEVQILAKKAAAVDEKALPGADQLAACRTELEAMRGAALAAWPHSPPDPTDWARLWMDDHAEIYVGRSRVPLGTVVEEYLAGASPDEIARAYDTVAPEDVHGAIAYYQRYRDDVDAYLKRRDAEAAELRTKIEATQPSNAELRARIRERWSQRKAIDASPAQ